MRARTAANAEVQAANLRPRERRDTMRLRRIACRRCRSVAGPTAKSLLELMHPRGPESQTLAEPFSLGRDHGDVRQLDLSPCLRGQADHQVLDSLHDLLFHGKDLAVDLSPAERLLHRGRSRGALASHTVTGITPAGGSDHVRSKTMPTRGVHATVSLRLP